MSNENQFVDPLEALITKHRAAQGLEPETNTTEPIRTIENQPGAVVETPQSTFANEEVVDYGENDLQDAIAKEAAAEEAARQDAIAKAAEARAHEEADKIPDSHDPAYYEDAIGYQTETIETVTKMVHDVVAKHNLGAGGIPVSTENEPNHRMHVMGELVNIYHMNGATITPEFEKLVIDNWVAEATVDAGNGNPSPVETAPGNIEETTTPPEDKPTTINITVQQNTPVTVNVDESIAAEINKTKEVNVYVREVSDTELRAAKIVENTDQEGIITVYDSGINDVPITLPASAYRCVMRPINWFDFLKLTTASSNNPSDVELKRWTVIYNHMKNVSIGPFKDFEDFMKKTKYQDRELLMWALLVATADEEEVLSLRCANEKCRSSMTVKYRPREIIHLDQEHIPAHYTKAHDVAPGPAAIALWSEVANKRRRFQLPNSKIIVEATTPSAYEFVTNKLALTEKLFKRYNPDGQLQELKPDDPRYMELDYLMANAIMIDAMTIVRDDTEYRFTTWDDIETIITTSLDTDDSAILMKIVNVLQEDVSPVSFYVENVECPTCKRLDERVPITDISNQLLFQVSRRLVNTKINLIEMD